MRDMEKIGADLIVFDLDGTLIDSSDDIAWAANKTLVHMGYMERDIRSIKKCIGWGVKILLEKLMPEEDEDRLEEARRKFLEYYWDHLTVYTNLYPGAREIIEYFGKMNKSMAIITNKPLRFTEKILEYFALQKYFSMVLGGDSLPNRKPHPEPALKVLTHLSISASRGVFVGDSPTDCETGRGAGMTTIGVSYGFREKEELENAGFDIIIDDLRDLKTIVR